MKEIMVGNLRAHVRRRLSGEIEFRYQNDAVWFQPDAAAWQKLDGNGYRIVADLKETPVVGRHQEHEASKRAALMASLPVEELVLRIKNRAERLAKLLVLGTQQGPAGAAAAPSVLLEEDRRLIREAVTALLDRRGPSEQLRAV